MEITGNNSNSCVDVSGDCTFVNAKKEYVGDENTGNGTGGANSNDPFAVSSVFSEPMTDKVTPISEVLVNDDVGNLNKDGVLEGEKDVERDGALLEKEYGDRGELGGSGSSVENGLPNSVMHVNGVEGLNGSATDVQPGGSEGSGASSGDKVATDDKLNEFVNPMSEEGSGIYQEKVEGVNVKGQEVEEDETVGALSVETLTNTPGDTTEKVMPISEVLVNDDVENLNKIEVFEGEKVVDRDGALLEEEFRGRRESGGSGSSVDNGFPISTMHVTGINGLNGSASEVQSGGLEGSEASCRDKVTTDEKLNEFVNPTGEGGSGIHQEKVEGVNVKGEEVEEDETTGEAINVYLSGAGGAIVGEERKDAQKQGEAPAVKGVASINVTDETKQIDLSGAGLVVVGEEREDVQKQEEVPANKSVASVNRTDETKKLIKDVANMTVSEVDDQMTKSAMCFNTETVKPKTVNLDVSEHVGENINDTRRMEIEKQPDKETDQMASHTIHRNDELISIQSDMEDGVSRGANFPVSAEQSSKHDTREILEGEDDAKYQIIGDGDLEGSISDQESDGMIFGSSEAARQFIEELERESSHVSHSGGEASRDFEQKIDGQIVTDSDEEVDTDEEGDGKQLLDSSALAALLKAATGADPDGGSITITSQDGSRLFSVERPAGLGSSLRSLRAAPQPNRSTLFTPTLSNSSESENNLSEEENKKLEKLQKIRVKFLRLVQRLGFSSDESIATQVLYRLSLIAGKQNSQLFSIDTARSTALQLETEGKDDIDFSVNILVLGKSGVGKSATINSILGEEKAPINAFAPATTSVKEICGSIDGVNIRVFDTPGLKSSAMEQAFNRSVLSTVKKFTKKNPIDIVIYVDRLDAQTRDLNDLPLLRTITSSLGSAIWRSTIVTLTHAASAPPDGPSGSPLSYEMFVTQRSRVVQQSIGHAMGDLHMMSPSMMNPVSLVENHPACRKNREGQRILPNGQIWKPQLLLLCYSMKILSEASSLSKPQDPFDHRKLFGFRVRSPPLPYMLSSMLQSHAHPKLSTELGGDNVDSDIDLEDLSDSDHEEEEYDQLPPFKPLRRAQIAKLSKEQRKAYFEEYDYRVKLLQKKQWREELRRMREMKKKGNDAAAQDYGNNEEDADSGAAAPVAVPLPDMALPPSFDGDNPTYRYRFLEPTSQFLARPVLDTHGWDHDCGYEGVNIEHSQAIANHFPAAVTVQISKDKKDFSISLDSSVSAKHGENGSSMAGFDIQNIGKQLAYIVRGETKFKNLKKNKTAGGISVTFLGENIVTGLKIEDQITLGKQYVLGGSAGTVRSRHETAYGANIELQRREADYPIGQVQSTLSMSVIKWRGDLALGFNGLAQFSAGRNSKVTVRAGINNKLSGQISVRTSSSENLSLALTGILPVAIAIYRKLYPSAAEKYSMY